MSLRWPHLLIIFLVALTLRGAFVLTRPPEIVYPDAQEYDYIARNLLATGQYQEQVGRQASRAPGYPLFLAGLYGLGLDSPRAVGLVQALLDAVMCVLLALLGRRLFGEAVGAVAGWMAAVYAFFIYFTWLLLAETVFTLGLVGLFLLLMRMGGKDEKDPENAKDGGWRHVLWPALAAGLLCGALTMLRSSFLLMPLFLLPFLLIQPGRRARRAAAWGVIMAATCLALLPWTIRNYRIFHHVIPATLQVGESLYEACSPFADGGPAMDRIPWDEERGGPMGEYENNEFFKNAALKYMRENPGRCLKLAAVKFVRFWNIFPNYSEFRSPLYLLISVVFSVPILALGIVGVWRNRGRLALLLLAPVIYYTLMHTVFVGSVRYRTPIMPFVLLFAAAGAVALWQKMKPRINTDEH